MIYLQLLPLLLIGISLFALLASLVFGGLSQRHLANVLSIQEYRKVRYPAIPRPGSFDLLGILKAGYWLLTTK